MLHVQKCLKTVVICARYCIIAHDATVNQNEIIYSQLCKSSNLVCISCQPFIFSFLLSFNPSNQDHFSPIQSFSIQAAKFLQFPSHPSSQYQPIPSHPVLVILNPVQFPSHPSHALADPFFFFFFLEKPFLLFPSHPSNQYQFLHILSLPY